MQPKCSTGDADGISISSLNQNRAGCQTQSQWEWASVSFGPRGLHYTIGPKGARITAGIPGTGLSWSEYTPHNTGPVEQTPFFAPQQIDPPLTAIENAPAHAISAMSTCELAPVLNSAQRRFRIAPLLQLISVLLFVLAFIHGNQNWMVISALYATIFVSVAILLDRYRRSVRVNFESQGAIGQIAEALTDSFTDLVACQSVWRVQAEGATTDWKRNAGATGLYKRHKIRPQIGKPACMRGLASFPALKLGRDEIYLLPDAALIVSREGVAAVNYHEFDVSNRQTKFIEEERVPGDAPVVGQTWRYVNKNGGPDARFNSNKQLPVCLYGELSFQSDGGLNSKIQYSDPAAADRLCRVIDVLHRSTAEFPRMAYVRPPKWWVTALFLSAAATFGAIQFAYFPFGAPPSKSTVDSREGSRPLSNSIQDNSGGMASQTSAPKLYQSDQKIGPQPEAKPIEPAASAGVPLPRSRPKN